ncbi:rod shape-determining protein, partial [Elusimicrobiota bacterium]
VAVISMGGIVVSKSVDVAGDEMDDAIMQYFRKRYNLLIGENSAEDVKIKIGSVFPLDEEKTMEVRGRDQVTGLPRTIIVTSEEIRQALLASIKTIVDMIKACLEETPAELAADLVDRGLVLAGGGALLHGFPELLSRETELSVHLAADPLDCVVLGTGKFLEELDGIDPARKRALLAK